MVLPAGDEVEVGLDLVDLDAASERDLTQARRLDLHGERNDVVRRRGVRQRRDDLDGAEDLEIEQRLRRRVDLGGRVGRPLLDVDGAAQRRLGDLLLAGAVAVRVEAGDRDGAEDRERPGHDLEPVVGDVRADVELGLRLDRGVGVAAIGERLLHGGLGVLELLLVEARSAGKRRPRRQARGVGDVLGEALEPDDHDVSIERRRALVDDDLDADVVRLRRSRTWATRACASRKPLER